MDLVQPLSRANTVGNRIDEYINIEMAHCNCRRKREMDSALLSFMKYLSISGMAPSSLNAYPGFMMSAGYSIAKVRRELMFIKGFLRWCLRMGYTEKSWHEYFPHIRSAPLPEPKIIGHEEYLQIRKACFNRDYEWLAVLGYSTGMRLGDCCSLRWSHVDQDEQVIVKVQNKMRMRGGAQTRVPYSSGSDLHVMLIERWNTRHDEPVIEEDNYVCPSMFLMNSNPNAASMVSDSFRAIFNKAGLPDKSFKHFRSTFESRMANSGMNLALAAKVTGRSDPRVLMRYIKPDMDAAREGVTKALELHHHIKGFA